MKLCAIGVRGHYGTVVRGLAGLPQVKIAGLCTGNPGEDISALEKAAAERGDSPVLFQDYRKMLDEIKPDMVSVCGPFEQHAQMCIEAFERKIHVICEKPVALTLEELAKLKAAQAKAGVHFTGLMTMRYQPAFLAAWKRVQAGAIGKVRLITAQKSYKLGKRPDYYTRRETYGGTIPWVGIHAIDWLYWFSGAKFQSVTAMHSRNDNRGLGECEMTAVVQFKMSGDIFATANLDYLRPESASTHGDDRVRVAGTEGVVEVRQGEARLVNGDGEKALPPVEGPKPFEDFVAQVEGKSQALLRPEDTWAVTEACLRARHAADEERTMKFPG